jgi:hypothetical protein
MTAPQLLSYVRSPGLARSRSIEELKRWVEALPEPAVPANEATDGSISDERGQEAN